MENRKFRVITDMDVNGKPIRMFVPFEEDKGKILYAVFGNYAVVDEAQIELAKKELLQDLFRLIEQIAEKDNFWIVKNNDGNKYSVGWKVHFPQMDNE